MLSGACVGTNDLKSAKAFYDVVLDTIDMTCHVALEHELGYGPKGGNPNFWVVIPYNEKPATPGNGSQVMFSTESEIAVQNFHKSAIDAGGLDEGAPGPRNYAPGYYGAYLRDLDGNKLHISIKL